MEPAAGGSPGPEAGDASASGTAAARAVIPACAGPSFPWSMKLATSLVVVLLLVWIVELVLRDQAAWTPAAQALGAAAMLVIIACWWGVMRSRTAIDGTHIRQTWLWTKEVAIGQMASCRLIHLPGFEWLVAPRLVVRTGGFGVVTFHAADARVLAAFRLLAESLRR